MKWKKLGQVYAPYSRNSWIQQFAMLPTPVQINNSTIRVFLGFCDSKMVGRVGFVDIDADNPNKILNLSETPCLDIGVQGCFDDNGVVPVSVINTTEGIYLYYVGFQLVNKGLKYTMFTGLAFSSDQGLTFERVTNKPILPPLSNNCYARCGTFVKKEGDLFKMWYIGSFEKGYTTSKDGKLLPLYTMFYSESSNGIDWDEFQSINCLNFETNEEYGFGRPYVWKYKNEYHMLFSIRALEKGYSIGYAKSTDGISWVRYDDLSGLSVSSETWENKNVSYPVLINIKSQMHVMYNGNGSGKTGFGLAKLIEW